MRRPFTCLVLMASCIVTHASDVDALALADSTSNVARDTTNWHSFAEYALSRKQFQADGSWTVPSHRLSLDVQWDKTLTSGLRLFFANRLDLNSEDQQLGPKRVNTLKEAYLSWHANDRWLVDAGRINLRYGVGLGYNPTDFFRDGAVRSVVSVDPMSLKTNRLGSVVLRTQQVWEGGSLTALVSPKLSTRQPSQSTFSPEVGATNHEKRTLLSLSQRITENFNPQVLLYQAEGQSAQLGTNLSVLLGRSTIVYLEWAGGRGRPLLSQLYGTKEPEYFINRLTSGVTFSTAKKLTWSAEYEYNGAGLDQAQWRDLGGTPQRYFDYRAYARQVQDPPAKRAMLVSVRWQDAFINRFDVSALARVNLDDRSSMWWIEGVQHFAVADMAVQFQRQSGSAFSEFGASPDKWAWQLLLRRHF